jgi:hypothetical protein
MRGGEERRSRKSLLARRLVVAKEVADRIEAELNEVPRWQVRRRADLQRTLEEARQREHGILTALGGKPSNGTGGGC